MSARPPAPSLDPERLLAEDQFVRGLARHLRRGDGAEDLAQQTFLAALERPPGPTVALRAWLAAVLRRIAGRRDRSEARERKRLEAAAQSERVPSTAEIVAREAMRAAVVRAVLELEEPYRAVVLLRYFENLTPRAITRRLMLPVETVRTRLKRAMASLRARLDRETDGGRMAWSALLLPLSRGPSGALATAAGSLHVLTGVLLMTTKAKLSMCAAALGGLLLWVVWVLDPFSLTVPPANDAGLLARPEVAQDAPPAASAMPAAAAASAPVRESVASTSAPTTGALTVRVSWGQDKSPAADLEVSLHREDDDDLAERESARSDAAGIARFERLAPGQLYAEVQRGDQEFSAWVKIVPGAVAQTTIEISPGMHVHGLVVDGDSKPVAGAEVLVSDWGGAEGLPLARTGSDGTFALRSVATHCHIGARAPGFAPSPLRQFTTGAGATVELRIVLDQPAAELTGTVLDPLGQPVAGAFVEAGSEEQRGHKLADGSPAMGPRPARARTDAAGGFVLRNLVPGTVPVRVRARGLSPWRKSLDLARGPNTQWVQLDRGVTIQGTVRDTAGQPVAKAQVNAIAGELGRRGARSGSDGAFRIDALPAGDLQVSAESQKHGKVTATLRGTAGETLFWNPALSSGLTQAGRVLDAEGKPVKSAIVEAMLERRDGSASWFGFESTDGEGRFSLRNCQPGQTLRVTVRRKSAFPEARLDGVVPGNEELVVRLPREAWIHIQGKVLDPDGKPLASVHVTPHMKGGNISPAESVEAATGAFRYGPYPPGEYQVQFSAPGHPRIVVPWHRVEPDQVWDLGTVQFQRGGFLVIRLREPGGDKPVTRRLTVYDAAGRWIEQCEVIEGNGRAGPLAAGDYVLQLSGDNLACAQEAFTVRGGADTRLDLEGRPGVRAEIEFMVPPGTAPDQAIAVVVRRADAGIVFRGNARARPGQVQVTPWLLPGEYQIEATCGALRGAARLTVGGTAPEKTMVTLAPR